MSCSISEQESCTQCASTSLKVYLAIISRILLSYGSNSKSLYESYLNPLID
jgi:hypothetical protein